jgi:NitT/TauT family transport system permease protein
MMTASSNFQVSLVFAGLIILAVLGVMLYALFSLLERHVTGWATRDTEIAIT